MRKSVDKENLITISLLFGIINNDLNLLST